MNRSNKQSETREVVIYRDNKGLARMIVPKQPPTKECFSPIGAEIVTYTRLPLQQVKRLLCMKKEEVSVILDSYVPNLDYNQDK